MTFIIYYTRINLIPAQCKIEADSIDDAEFKFKENHLYNKITKIEEQL